MLVHVGIKAWHLIASAPGVACSWSQCQHTAWPLLRLLTGILQKPLLGGDQWTDLGLPLIGTVHW